MNNMLSLIEVNPYIRDTRARREMLQSNARQSSMFEGARGLPKVARQTKRRNRRSIASVKKLARKR